MVVASCASAACFFELDRERQEEPAALVLAVGARVTLHLDRCGLSEGRRVCTDLDPREITSVTVDDEAFEVGPLQIDDWQTEVSLRATRPGQARLTIGDATGRQTEQIWVRAAEVTHAELEVGCEGHVQDRSAVAVRAETRLGFRVQAMAGATPLLSGDLELVEAEGFALTPPGDGPRYATAPAQTGSYQWSWAGDRGMSFTVYQAEELEPTLAGQVGEDGATVVTVGRTVGGVEVCAHGRDERVTIQVTSGPCLPATSYAQVVGPMPVNLGNQPWSFTLATTVTGVCSVEVRLDAGRAVTATFSVQPAEAEAAVTGRLIGEQGAEIADAPPSIGSCTGSLSDGDCDGEVDYVPVPVDGDCYINSNWSFDHRDGTGGSDDAIGENDYIGVGLRTELRMLIVADALALFPLTIGPPQNLQYAISPDGALELASLGCSERERHQVFSLVARESSPFWRSHSLELEADNLDDTAELSFRARAVETAVFNTADLDGWGGPVASAADVDFFTGSHAGIHVEYRGGGARLRGTAPVLVTSDSPTAALSSSIVYTGDTPGTTITLTSPVAPAATGAQRIRVRAVADIGDIGGFEFNVKTAQGEQHCADVYPRVSTIGRIYGKRPLPRLSLSGTAYVMGEGRPGEFCLAAFAAGASQVTLSWGDVSRERTWMVSR